MRRFYTTVTVGAGEDGGGYALRLDGRRVKTPARAPLAVPGRALAEAIAEEWRAQGETIAPRTMPLTGLANAALDRVAPDPAGFATGLARYGESDLLCYRAATPAGLVARQASLWDPILGWARRRYDGDIKVGAGIVHLAQPPGTLAQLGQAVAACDAFRLAGLSPLVTVSGSLLIALALAEGAIDLDQAWAAAALEEHWQAETWGEDAAAAAALANRREDFAAAARFLALLDAG